MRRKLMDEQALSGSLENALAENQFIVYFQPKYRLSDGKLAGAEALVRWNHPERGLIPPNLFIPLFERNGQISSLDKYVWKKTSESVRRWIDKYGKSVPVSVNISRVDVYEPLLPEVLEKIITDSGVTSENIYLEITESAYTRDPEQLIDIVKKLKEKGFTIEMDDFGSGYSSLNMLNRLPIDVLKLDLKFLENSKITMEDPGLMTYIMGIAKWMNVPVVAEGAETKEQVDLMKHLGCEYVQGYYFSKPLPPEEFEKRMVKDS
jgi:EAL domain-containing protein (putative c-di-GMP-specific phosphodiesterase class I)